LQASTAIAKKNDVCKRVVALGHIGLLLNWPPGAAGLPFNQSSKDFDRIGIFRVATGKSPLTATIVTRFYVKNKCAAPLSAGRVSSSA
jgi:hypothetical protein